MIHYRTFADFWKKLWTNLSIYEKIQGKQIYS